MRYYVHDLESDKVEIHTGGKADWLTLPEADRSEIKRACLWSGSRNCWVSRTKGGLHSWVIEALKRNGFECRGTKGERPTMAERVAEEQRRAADRADRMEGRAQAAGAEAHARFNSHNIETVRGLQGEPVKIGHHSERRHRRLLEKADNDMRKGCEALGKKAHYESRAESANYTASGEKYTDPRYLNNRIKERESEERLLLCRLDGKYYANGSPATFTVTPERKAQLEERLAIVREELAYFRGLLEALGGFTRESLKGKTEARDRFGWARIVRLNRTTVTLAHADGYSPKRPYAEITEAR